MTRQPEAQVSCRAALGKETMFPDKGPQPPVKAPSTRAALLSPGFLGQFLGRGVTRLCRPGCWDC